MKQHRVRALLLKYWYISLSAFRLFDIFFWPILGLVVFGFTALYFTDLTQAESLLLFLLGGLILWTLFERAQHDINLYVLEDFWEQNVSNTFLTPVRPSEFVVALSITSTVRALLSTAIMYAVALIGYHFDLLHGGAEAMLFFIPLLVFGYAIGMLINALVFSYGQKISVLVWSLSYLLQPIAGAFYPIETLPRWLQTAAHMTPLHYTFEGYRLSYSGGFALEHFAVAVGFALVYAGIGVAAFVAALHRARKKGLLVNY